jgi:transposase-like protein
VSMIQEIVTYRCRVCGSTNIIKNGTNRLKQQQYYCKDCGTYRVLVSKREAKKRESGSFSELIKSE